MAKSKRPKHSEQKIVETATKPEQNDNPNAAEQAEEQASTRSTAPETFESLYLQQITAEFADDIDRLRNANDFNEKSVPILIEALKQTACVYSEEEKRKVMG